MARSYNLIDMPWIPVIEASNSISYLGLKELFLKAHELKDIYHEFSIEEISLRKFLIAVSLCIMKDSDKYSYNSDAESWNQLYKKGSFSKEKITAYFEKWHSRFDLFDDEYPFYQYKGTTNQIYVSNVFREFPGTHINRFVSCKSEIKNHKIKISELAIRTISYNMFYIGAGSGNIASLNYHGMSFWIKGKNIFESLLLNCPADNSNSPTYKPVWEYDDYFNEKQSGIPTSYVDYLTIQPRKFLIELPESVEDINKDTILELGTSSHVVNFYGSPGRTSQIETDEKKSKVVAYYDPMMPFKNDTYVKYRFETPFWLNLADYYLSRKNKDGACPYSIEFASEVLSDHNISRFYIFAYDFLLENTTKIVKAERIIFPYYPTILDNYNKITTIQNMIKKAVDVDNIQLFNAVDKYLTLSLKKNIEETTIRKSLIDKKTVKSSPVFKKYWAIIEKVFYQKIDQISEIQNPDDLQFIENDWAKFVRKTAINEFMFYYQNDEKYKALIIAENEFFKNKKEKNNGK